MRFARLDPSSRVFAPRGGQPGAGRRPGAALALALAALSFAALVRAETIDGGALAAAAQRCVRESFGTRVEVETVCGPVPALGLLQGEEAELKARMLGSRRTSGPALVSVEFWQDGVRLGERSMTVQTRLYQQVLVARESLGRGAVLEPQQFTVERREVTAVDEAGPPSVQSVTGMRLRRPVPAGGPVLAADLEPVPLVRRGDKVTVTVNVGGITVSMPAVALDDGAAGTTVPVKNERSGRRLDAVVVGPGAVRVQLDDPSMGG